MPRYTVIYGGQQHIEAMSQEEAYEKFWRWLIEQAEGRKVGLIVDAEEPKGLSTIDLGAGGLVVCDSCNTDYSTSDEPGGVMHGGAAYGPCCAVYVRRSRTMKECPEGMSFRAWMLSLRAP